MSTGKYGMSTNNPDEGSGRLRVNDEPKVIGYIEFDREYMVRIHFDATCRKEYRAILIIVYID